MKELTLCFLKTDTSLCLAMKKRGFGAGKYNGFGGKIELGETIHQAACREINEESGVQVTADALEPIGQFDFIYIDEGVMRVHAFLVHEWHGKPVETEEMQPEWFAFDDIPYEVMWEDDQHWLPRVLQGERLRGTVWFDKSGEKIREMEWEVVEEI